MGSNPTATALVLHTRRVVPDVQWAPSGDVTLAYQVVGAGPRDVVMLFAGVSHLEVFWELPEHVDFIARLSRLGRVILYDKRGVGLSDRPAGPVPTLETYADDLVAVLDAAGSERAVVFGWLMDGATALAAAARHPDRIEAVIAGEVLGSLRQRPDHPWGLTPAEVEQVTAVLENAWGEAAYLSMFDPGMARDPRLTNYFRRLERMSTSPAQAARLLPAMLEIDVRPYLARVRAPVLLLHDTRNDRIPMEGLRWLADQLTNVHLRTVEDSQTAGLMPGQRVLDEMEEFLTGERSGGGRDRQICVVLVSDVAGSTEQLAADGGELWRRRLESHRRGVRTELRRHEGREVDTAGDGFLAVFDLASRAVACAVRIRDAAAEEGLRLRIGLHAGEVTARESGVTGLAVHVAARVAAAAGPGEVLVSDTVSSLLLGVGGAPPLEPLRARRLKGVPGMWRLHRIVEPAAVS